MVLANMIRAHFWTVNLEKYKNVVHVAVQMEGEIIDDNKQKQNQKEEKNEQ